MKINPMLAESGSKDFTRPNFIFEPKVDGVRCIAFLNSDGTRLQSRSGKDITFKFPELQTLHTKVKEDCILDGEVMGENFNATQHRVHQQKSFAIRMAMKVYPVKFHGFDVMHLAEASTKTLLLMDRKDMLIATYTESDVGLILPWFTDYEEAKQLRGNMANIHLFTENVLDMKTNISQRGKNESTKYFLIPKEARSGLVYDAKITCQRIDTSAKPFFVFAINKLGGGNG